MKRPKTSNPKNLLSRLGRLRSCKRFALPIFALSKQAITLQLARIHATPTGELQSRFFRTESRIVTYQCRFHFLEGAIMSATTGWHWLCQSFLLTLEQLWSFKPAFLPSCITPNPCTGKASGTPLGFAQE